MERMIYSDPEEKETDKEDIDKTEIPDDVHEKEVLEDLSGEDLENLPPLV